MGDETNRNRIARTGMSISSTRANSSMSTGTTVGTTIANGNLNEIGHEAGIQTTNLSSGSFDPVRQVIRTHPLIDTHAHPLISCPANYADYPFERTILGVGAQDSPCSNSKIREIEVQAQLAEYYKCEPQWPHIRSVRYHKLINERLHAVIARQCLRGTQVLLLDGDFNDGDIGDMKWHVDVTHVRMVRKIVRVESLAISALKTAIEAACNRKPTLDSASEQLHLRYRIDGYLLDADPWVEFHREFVASIDLAIKNPDVAALKSVICYRSGLDIQVHANEEVLDSFETLVKKCLRSRDLKKKLLDISKPLHDYLVRAALARIESWKKVGVVKPILFHTGQGHCPNIAYLHRSVDPVSLEPVIREFKDVEFVLLHSSPQCTQQAARLTHAFPNIHLDIGEGFTALCREEQAAFLRQVLELVPSRRILWSTDGYHHPETFWLANRQVRQALETVMKERIANGCPTAEAIILVQNFLFNNANELYNLQQTVDMSRLEPSSTTYVKPPPEDRPLIPPRLDSDGMTHGQRKPQPSPQLPGYQPPDSWLVIDTAERLASIVRSNMSLRFVWMQWVDYTATVRVRMFTLREFQKIALGERRVGVTMAVSNTLQNDQIIGPHVSIAGQYYLKPDLRSLHLNVGIPSESATVMCSWRNENGSSQDGCPRTILDNLVEKCRSEHHIELLFGFEIEVVFMEKTQLHGEEYPTYKPWVQNHCWSTMTSDTRRALPLIEQIVTTLTTINIHIEQFHTESAPSQFEFVLPPSPPLHAIDTLLKARQTIVHIAEQHNLRATLYPRPFPNAAGTASHAHLSITPAEKQDSFLAGILHHLPAITALTCPQEASYERIKHGRWSGGIWVSWGTQNRETPVRKIGPGHWEIKCFDGLANVFLGMAAVVAGGYLGLNGEMELDIRDCRVDPAGLEDKERKERYGIKAMMPRCLEESLAWLERDKGLRGVLGDVVVERYVGVKKGEREMLRKMGERERREWLIERY